MNNTNTFARFAFRALLSTDSGDALEGMLALVPVVARPFGRTYMLATCRIFQYLEAWHAGNLTMSSVRWRQLWALRLQMPASMARRFEAALRGFAGCPA